MECLNKVTLIGRVGSVRRTKTVDGKTIVRFTVCTNFAYMDERHTPVIESTWHECQALQKDDSCELASIDTGSAVHVEGRIRNVRYVNSEGNDAVHPEIVVSKIKIVENE